MNKRFDCLGDWLSYIERLSGREIELGLSRVGVVAQALDVLSPSAKVVTVGGTNGKGSTVAAVEALVLSQGKRVGCYTSPHLFHYCERVRVDGEPISEALMCEAFEAVEVARGDVALTYFEFGTLAALWVFRQEALDIVVLEVGLGGRLDAVNVVDADIAVITSIGIDHVEWLGETREKIGAEKAGILRDKQLFVCGEKEPPDSLMRIVGERECVSYFLGQDFFVDERGAVWSWAYEGFTVQELPAHPFVKANLACAFMVGYLLFGEADFCSIDFPTVVEGLRLPGRFQCVERFGRRHIFDVGHNVAAAEWLVASLARFPCEGKRFAVVGMLNDKQVVETLRILSEGVDAWFLTVLDTPRSLTVGQLQAVVEELGLTAQVFGGFDEAYQKALTSSDVGDDIVVFGSFYTVASGLGLQDDRMTVK